MLYKKGSGMEAKLCFIGNELMENRSGPLVDARLTRVSDHTELLATLEIIEPLAERPPPLPCWAQVCFCKTSIEGLLNRAGCKCHLVILLMRRSFNCPT
jgi:hypothetical protein